MTEEKPTLFSKQRGRMPNSEEAYFMEASYKNTVESIRGIEDAAKFFVGATATTSGLFLAASKLSFGEAVNPSTYWMLPFISWAIAIIFHVLVLFPLRYRAETHLPLAMKAAFLRAQKIKYVFLSLGAICFIFGLIASIFIMVK
jgi:hypothetical protein